ncbi:MAG: cell filamentation protein Fic [Alphaproteobacteria bacterium]|nr:cell filamentation protein Fic [Alphaproteobacteria bacterium]
MADARSKLATSLAVLRERQSGGKAVFRTSAFGRTDRERLIRHGFLREIVKGWVMSASPAAQDGDSTPWYAAFWEFCSAYAAERFGTEWHLSAEQSIHLHAGRTTIPAQVVLYSPRGANNTLALPFATALYDLRQPAMPPAGDLTTVDGLRLFTPAAALTRVPEDFFRRWPVEAAVALRGIDDASDLLRRLLSGGHTVVAGRLAGAFRRLGRTAVADDIAAAMASAGHGIRETDPFDPARPAPAVAMTAPPLVERLRALWQGHRGPVLDVLPPAPGRPANAAAYLRRVEDLYGRDAYHSLSIEGYRVSPTLIERVRSGAWDPVGDAADRQSRDALAARGYWQAFQRVEQDVARILDGAAPGPLLRDRHRAWYRALFEPGVAAGMIGAADLAGYRADRVFIRGSRHVPPRAEAVADAMAALFDLIDREPEPGVSAVLGHWLFGYVHPYPDGNGRLARFLMNALLAAGGYPWTVIRVDHREGYLDALERASVDGDIAPFARFLGERIARAGHD